MTVKISNHITRTSEGMDPRTGKLIRKIFHPNGTIEIYEITANGDIIRKIQ